MDVTERIMAAYRGVPGLRLTTMQAGRLWALDIAHCERLLNQLVTGGHLYLDTRNQYVLTGPVLPMRAPVAQASRPVSSPPAHPCE